MEQIIVTRTDQTTWPLLNKANVTSITKAVQKRKLLDEDVVQMSVVSSVALQFYLGDKITIYGSTYTLNAPAKFDKTGDRKFAYEIVWEGRQYDLIRALYLGESSDGVSISPDFSLAGDLNMFMDVLINNLNRVFGYGIWQKGECPVTDVKTLTYSNENCLAVLQNLCSEENFKKEFEIIENGGVCTINIKDTIGQVHTRVYEFGKGKGLYNLSRQNISNKNIVTRLYVFGSDKNLPSDYRGYSQRLKLPGNDKSYIEDPAAVAAYGLIEGVKVFDEIFPHRTGTVSSLGSTAFEFVDSSMDFDLKAVDGGGNTLYLIDKTSAKIHFNTGNLAGYEFEVLDYVHATKKFTIKSFIDERNQQFPDPASAAFQIAAGDKYVIVDVVMPQTYITAGESDVEIAGTTYYNQNSQPRVQYSQVFDEMMLKQLYSGDAIVNVFGVGDSVPIRDTDIGVDKAIRIKSFTRDVIYPYRYTNDLSDIIEANAIQRILASNIDTEKVIAINKLRDVARAKRNWKSIGEVYDMIFDTDGYFDGTRIKPETIETMMLTIGVPSQALTMDCTIQPNYNGNPNLVSVPAGSLYHFGEDKTWNIAQETVTLTDNGAYYIYAKCSKTNTSAIILFSQNKIKVNDDAGYFHFLLGYLLSISSGTRWIKLTYSYTTINGGEIMTGNIVSLDGLTYFNLNTGEIGGKIVFGSGSSGYNNLSDKPNLSDMATQTYVNGIRDLLQGQLDGQIISWFYDYDPTTSNLPASDWTTTALKEAHANDTFTNTDSGGCWRWQISGGVWGWGVITDTATQQALILAQEALDTADGKRRVFVSQPTTPYDTGDLWVTGTQSYFCNSGRSTGAYNGGDWTPTTNHDRTQTVIDNGLITTGRLEVGSGNYTEGNAWINGSVNPGDPNNDYRFGAGASFANRANAKFWVKDNGSACMKGAVEIGTEAVSDGVYGLMNAALKGKDLWENSYAGNAGHLDINRVGYNGGNTYFRDVYIFDGKGYPLLWVDGSEKWLQGNFNKVTLSNSHRQAIGYTPITCSAIESDMYEMTVNITPVGTYILIMFSAPFYVTASNQTLHLFMNIAGANQRHTKEYITSGFQVISFQHMHPVTAGLTYTVKIRWSGSSAIQQRSDTDSERVLTVIDLM